MILFRSIFFVIASVGLVHSTAIKRQAIVALSPEQINAFAPYTHFASAAYCNPSTTMTWSCGANCQANPFIPVAAGGDGNSVQFWYVGYSPLLKAVIVAHQGTIFDVSHIYSILTDLELIFVPLIDALFPGVPSAVLVHNGFANQQALTAELIFFAVRDALSTYSTSSVITVDHSLGAALALLDGLYLRIQFPDVSIGVVTYGMPRVGNQDFANFVDATLGGRVLHVNNQKDPIPVLPPISAKFHHPSGEIHINSSTWEDCPGQDNPSTLCIVGAVPDVAAAVLEGDLKYHNGPYAGITMGC